MKRKHTLRSAVLVVVALVVVLAGCSSDGGESASDTSAASTATSTPPARHHELTPEEIETYQQDLDDVGCWAGPVDGVLGPRTEAALREFQEAEGLTITGLFGGESQGALIAAAQAGEPVCAGASSGDAETAEPRPVDEAAVHEIEVWQHDLNAVGCWAGPVDGRLGPQTVAAIRNFQTATNAPVTGQLDPSTESDLAESAAEGGQICHIPTASTDGGPPPGSAGGSSSSGSTSTTGASSGQATAPDCQVNSHGPWPTQAEAQAYIEALAAAGFGGFGTTAGQGGPIVVRFGLTQQQAQDLVAQLHAAGYGARFYCEA